MSCKISLTSNLLRDQFFMRIAINFARNAKIIGEVPIGAVVVCNNIVVSGGFNQPIHCHDPSSHAELVAIRHAARKIKNYRLVDCELFTTLEPCVMCAGAIMNARIHRVVFGAFNARAGSAGSIVNLFDSKVLNHHTVVTGGIESEACQSLLKDFFLMKRKTNLKNADS